MVVERWVVCSWCCGEFGAGSEAGQRGRGSGSLLALRTQMDGDLILLRKIYFKWYG